MQEERRSTRDVRSLVVADGCYPRRTDGALLLHRQTNKQRYDIKQQQMELSTTTAKPTGSSATTCSSGNRVIRLRQSKALLLVVGVYGFIMSVAVCSKSEVVQLLGLRVSICSVLGLVGFIVVSLLVPKVQLKLLKRGLCGMDLNKINTDTAIPESLGLVGGVVFLLAGIGTQLLLYDTNDKDKLVEFNAGLLAICFMTFLGFADDVLDLPWRYKMILPCCASLPLLLAYRGSTTILVPEWLCRSFGLPPFLSLGFLYYIYMGMLAVFCTNSINIYAGVNGLEVGQSLIICAFIMLHNVMEIVNFSGSPAPNETVTVSGSPATSNDEKKLIAASQHFFSLMMSMPFFACSLALFCYNWFPSAVFVGDTFTYFAGMYFAVVGIFGHFSKTLLLFFIPQVLNFLISAPQLLGYIPCPRHRVPRVNQTTGCLHASPNLTLINLVLRLTGPLAENVLVFYLLLFQVVSCCGGLFIRYSPLYKLFL
eukprot:GHVS01012791.1.p1 GENE.GHVS01012791.1~~GHVS01012791.1.p1  ORF type:complete len:481 (-),score=57.64 GHVS01012791.1:319-1761(-)